MRKSRKLIAILATLALLATLLVPMATPAAADTGYSAYSTPTVSDEGWYTLGTVILEAPADAIHDGSTVIFNLPKDFKFAPAGASFGSYSNFGYDLSVSGDVYTRVSAPASVAGTSNALCHRGDNGQPDNNPAFTVQWLEDNQIKLTVNNNYSSADGDKAFVKIEMPKVWVDEGFSGDIKFTGDAPDVSGFPSGSVVVGRVAGGAVTISVIDKDTSNDDFFVKLRIKENRVGALKAENETIKLTLPDGFKWRAVGDVDGDGIDDDSVAANGTTINESVIWGDNLNLTVTFEDEEASLNLAAKSQNSASCFEVVLHFEVADETDAEFGDVKAEVGGETDATPDELVVGTYGDFGATIKIDGDAPEVFAGKTEQDTADIIIEEGMRGSLVNNRTILLTLPANARWIKIDNQYVISRDLNDDGDTGDANEGPQLTSGEKVADDSGVELEYRGMTGTDNRTVKLVVTSAPSDSAAELKIEDIQIALEAGKTGDIAIEVSGSAGLSGSVVIAKAVAPVTASAESKPDVQIGKSGQVGADLTITETKKGAIKKNSNLVLDLPEGVAFAAVPKVEVTEGDLKIDTANVRRGDSTWTKDNQVIIPIDNDSDKPSTIKVTGIKYVLDRTVPEGPVNVAVTGSAVVETIPTWPNSKAAAVAANAVCVTPAPGEQKATVVFTISDTKYTVNGVEKEMDAAPYIKDGRTFIPVRYAAEACGVTADNIMYADGKVTLIKGDKVVQLTIGSNVMLINGTPITMDVAPEIVDPGRTMLPFRWIAQALGAKVNWDEAAQTVTLEL